jgi:hypothetical protein
MAEEKNSEERGVKPRSQVSPTLIKHKNKPGNSSPRVPLEQNVMDSQLQAQRLHLANEKMAAITQKTHLEAKLAKMKDENCYQTVHFEERPQKTAALAFLSSENKSTMTDLTSAQLDLIMADFANFKKSYQVA